MLYQYATKKPTSNSLIILYKKKLEQYNLPSITELYQNTPQKHSWKKIVKDSVIKITTNLITKNAQDMSSLKYLWKSFEYNTIHPVVNYIDNPRQVACATVKSLLLTGTYPLQTARYRMKKATSPLCLLCQLDIEDTMHFVLTCPHLDHIRAKYLPHIKKDFPGHTDTLLLQALMDTSILFKQHKKKENVDQIRIENITRDYMFALHLERSQRLKPDK